MKVALVTDWFHPRVGGIEVHVLLLARRLRDRGHDVVVVTPWPGEGVVDGIRVRRLDVPLVPRLGVCLAPFRLVRAVREVLLDEAPDLAHGHVSFASTTVVAAGWVGWREGIPALGTFHSTLGALGWVYRAVAPVLRVRSWPFRATAVSPEVARDVAWILPDREVGILPNAVDPAEWSPKPAPGSAGGEVGRLRLVTTARLQARKRVDALLEIVARLRENGAGDVTLEIVGDGPRRPGLERAARRLGLDGAVRFVGATGPDGVRAALARSDVFVNACVLESFGIASLEALASGVPVVAREEGGVDAFVEDGRNGLLVGSDDAMVDALTALSRDLELRARLREGALEGVPAELTWARSVDRHLELYRTILEGSVAGIR